MTTLHDFLDEHAKFPVPVTDECQTVDATDISVLDVSKLDREWRAGHAVRDDTLVQKLCHTLENILGSTPVAAGNEHYLLSHFSPLLPFDELGSINKMWTKNPSEVHVRFHFLKSESKLH